MQPKAKFWLETDSGKHLLGPGVLRLLLAVEETRSLKAGARAIGLSYRSAWDRLKQTEAGLGFALLERHSGGEGGGGSALTPEAQDLAQRYGRFLQSIEAEVETHFARAFRGWT